MAHVAFIALIFVIHAALWHPEMKFPSMELLSIGIFGSVLPIPGSSGATSEVK